MVVLGGIVWAVSAAYNFIAANTAANLAVLVLTGAVSLIVFGLSRIGKSKPEPIRWGYFLLFTANWITPRGYAPACH